MTEKIKYNLIGVIASLNECADFVRPVFEKEGIKYFQYGKNGIICSFKEIPKELKNRVLTLNSINISTNIELKEIYTIGDDSVVAFRINNKSYFLSDINNFLSFINTYNTEDEILREEIDIFIDCVNRKDKQKKLVKQKI